MKRLNVPATLRRVAVACPDLEIKARLLSAADAVIEPAGVEPGVHPESMDPMEALTASEEALLPVFDGKSSKDDLVRAASDMGLTLAAWTRQLDTILEALDAENPEFDGVRSSLETMRQDVEALVPWAQKWKDIANTELEKPVPKFPPYPKTTLPSPEAETEETEAEAEEMPRPKATIPEEAADSSILDAIADSTL